MLRLSGHQVPLCQSQLLAQCRWIRARPTQANDSSAPFSSLNMMGGLGAYTPITFEAAVRSGDLRDDAHYAYLQGSSRKLKDRNEEGKLISFGAPLPPHAVKQSDPPLDHGVTGENTLMSAEVEEEYYRSSRAMQRLGGASSDIRGLLAEAGRAYEPSKMEAVRSAEGRYMLEGQVTPLLGDGAASPDPSGIEEGARTSNILLSPFGETVIPSTQRAYSDRQGEYQYMTEYKQVANPTYELAALGPLALASQRVERALLDVAMSPMAIDAKRDAIGKLCGAVFGKGLMLRAGTVETVVGVLSATTKKDLWSAKEALKALPTGTAAALKLDGSAPADHRAISIPCPNQTLILSLYHHLKGTFTAPTANTIERVMRVLHQSIVATTGGQQRLGPDSATALGSAKNQRSRESFAQYNTAHRLLLDCDRYFVVPSRATLSYYFAMCSHFDDMETAVRRFVDAQENLAIIPNSSMIEALVRGMTRCGLVGEALALLGRVDEVSMNVSLFNATMEALLLSNDASACFAAYSSIQNTHGTRSSLIIPNSDTFSLLLLACEKCDDWAFAPTLLRHMQEYKVRGDANCLNLLLKGLLKNGLQAYSLQLHASMAKKSVPVWPALQQAVAGLHQEHGAKTMAGRQHIPSALKNAILAPVSDNILSEVSRNGYDAMLDGIDPSKDEEGEEYDDGRQGEDDHSAELTTAPDADLTNAFALNYNSALPTRDDDDDATITDTPFWDIGGEGEKAPLSGPEAETEEVAAVPRSSEGTSRSSASKGSRGRNWPDDAFNRLRRERQFITPRSQRHLEELLKQRKGSDVDPSYLLHFLEQASVPLSEEQARSPTALLRKAHKHLFGTNGGVAFHFNTTQSR